MRRHANWIAALLTLALVFSQALVAAHACPIVGPPATTTPHEYAAAPMPDCAGMPQSDAPIPNVCEPHCLTGQHAQQTHVVPPLAPLPALTVHVEAPRATVAAASTDIPPRATPPPRLRFSRLLI